MKIYLAYWFRGLLLILAAGLFVACGGSKPAHDPATTRTSDAGLYRVSWKPAGEAVTINQLDSWTLTVRSAVGEPVLGAQIGVSGGMPEHNHGLPTQPEVTAELGEGRYLVEGLRFHMSGWWTMTFAIRSAAGEDSVTFNLDLE